MVRKADAETTAMKEGVLYTHRPLACHSRPHGKGRCQVAAETRRKAWTRAFIVVSEGRNKGGRVRQFRTG